jgi:hypothetical protein
MSTGGSFLGSKWPGSEADHSPSCSAYVKNGGAITPSPSICHHGVELIEVNIWTNLPLPIRL